MKGSAILTYVEMQGTFPALGFAALQAVADHPRGCTEHEAHDYVAEMRPKATAYSSIRSRFWELEIMGLISEIGTREVRIGNGKSRTHTLYGVTHKGAAMLASDPVNAVAKMKELMRVIHIGRERRAAACKPIVEQHAEMMRSETRAIVDRYLGE